MAEVKGYNMPDDLYYHKEHMWVKLEGDTAIIGLTDFSQKLAGEMSFIEMPEEDSDVKKDEVVGSYETGKWMGKIFAPLTGKVIGINEEVEDDPSLINSDPYGRGWIYKLQISNSEEINELMKGEDVIKWLEKEIAKHEEK